LVFDVSWVLSYITAGNFVTTACMKPCKVRACEAWGFTVGDMQVGSVNGYLSPCESVDFGAF